MATYHERADLAGDPTFIARVRQAAVKYALYISPQPATADADVRMAKSVLGAPDHWAATFAIAAAANDFILSGDAGDGSIDSDAGDTALSSVVEGQVWPAYAAEVD
jgi:hypothetical protein